MGTNLDELLLKRGTYSGQQADCVQLVSVFKRSTDPFNYTNLLNIGFNS